MYIAYTLLLACALLVSLPWWLLQLLRLGKYRAGLAERFGFIPPRLRAHIRPGCIWVHAVSVGEVLAVAQLISDLRAANPQTPLVVSTTTAAAQGLARERFGPGQVFYAPLDFGFAVQAYLDVLRPTLLILAETEFWPNLLHLARASGALVAIVNARVSDRSFPRYRRFRWFFSRVLSEINLFLAQSEQDAMRLKEIGAPAERVTVSGNMKFDIRNGATSPIQESLQRALGELSFVVVCGSTTEGEEPVLLRAFAELLPQSPNAVMVLAPRHPERFETVAKIVSESGLPLVRRSTWAGTRKVEELNVTAVSTSLQGAVFLLDSIGELASIYALADIAFVGGSLPPGAGGHNILEPAQYGVPVLVGPNTSNFREIVGIFGRGGGLLVVKEEDLSKQLQRLSGDPAERQRMGERAKELFLENSGASARAFNALESLLQQKAMKAP